MSVYLYYNYNFFLFIIIFVVVFYCIYFIEIMYNNIQVHDVVHAQYCIIIINFDNQTNNI